MHQVHTMRYKKYKNTYEIDLNTNKMDLVNKIQKAKPKSTANCNNCSHVCAYSRGKLWNTA